MYSAILVEGVDCPNAVDDLSLDDGMRSAFEDEHDRDQKGIHQAHMENGDMGSYLGFQSERYG